VSFSPNVGSLMNASLLIPLLQSLLIISGLLFKIFLIGNLDQRMADDMHEKVT
jgi:hypothetical protein